MGFRNQEWCGRAEGLLPLAKALLVPLVEEHTPLSVGLLALYVSNMILYRHTSTLLAISEESRCTELILWSPDPDVKAEGAMMTGAL